MDFAFFCCYEPLTIGFTCTKKGNGGDDDQHTSKPSANSPAADEIQVKKKYDAHQTHVFLLLWKTKWPWVEYNTSKDVMFCQTCHKSAAHRFGALHKVADKTDIKDWATVYKAQVSSIMEYACLVWMNASQTTLSQLDSIQRKALTIIGVATLAINSLHHMRQVAASTMQYRMHTNHSPSGLKALLPPTWERRHTTRSCTSMPAHALSIPRAETCTLDRSFLHTDISIWSNLPETTVGEITFIIIFIEETFSLTWFSKRTSKINTKN